MHGMKRPRIFVCILGLLKAGPGFSSLPLLLVLLASAGSELVHGQAEGFISIDCGASQGSVIDNLTWTVDSTYTTLGENAEIPVSPPYDTLRYFPDTTFTKSCYVFNTTANSSYLIRAGFIYGNYDNLSSTEGQPSFVLLFGANIWTGVTFDNDFDLVTHEMIVVASSDTSSVCLGRSDGVNRNPFISSLEIRPLSSNMYSPVYQSLMMKTNSRIDFGNNGNSSVRFPDDVYDRIWVPDSIAINNISFYNTTLNTSNIISVTSTHDLPPSKVMQTARSPNKVENMSFIFMARSGPGQYYVAFYFAELDNNTFSQIMNVLVDESLGYSALNVFDLRGPYNALELYATNYTIADGNYSLILMPTTNSTMAPMINAAESYFLQKINSSTLELDVQTLEIIKSSFNLSNWMGDPCIPDTYKWSWLSCDSIDNQARVIALNLSGFGIQSEIPPALGSLSALTSVDLHNNSLYGSIPSSLANLSSLNFLDLSFNNLSGEYPAELNKLNFSISGNPFICINDSCSESATPAHAANKIRIIGFVLAALFASVAAAVILVVYRCKSLKQKKLFLTQSIHWPPVPPYTEISKSVDSRAVLGGHSNDVPVFSFADMRTFTNDFENEIEDGGKGTCYRGTLPDGQEIVVRLLEPDLKQTPMEFLYKVTPLSYVNHRNLLRPIGFCAELHHFMFIYEGAYDTTLYNYLRGKSPVDWRARLSILQQVAQGLEHLHSSSIIHGGLRSGNVFLSGDGSLVKVSDFGIFALSQNSFTVAGHVDCENVFKKTLMKLDDIFSFGVLILEVVCGYKTFNQYSSKDAQNFIDWVGQMYEGGKDDYIADASLGGNYKKSALFKVIKLGLKATSRALDRRPSMMEIVIELKEANKIETGHHVAFAEVDNSNVPEDLEAPLASFDQSA